MTDLANSFKRKADDAIAKREKDNAEKIERMKMFHLAAIDRRASEGLYYYEITTQISYSDEKSGTVKYYSLNSTDMQPVLTYFKNQGFHVSQGRSFDQWVIRWGDK